MHKACLYYWGNGMQDSNKDSQKKTVAYLSGTLNIKSLTKDSSMENLVQKSLTIYSGHYFS